MNVKKRILSLFLALVMVLSMAMPAQAAETDRFVTGEQAVSAIDNKDYVIIDVRAKERHAVGHLKGSVSLPLFTVDADNKNVPVEEPYEDELSQAFLKYANDNKETLATKTIYILCNSGKAGVTNAFALMEKVGLKDNVFGITGGAGGDVVKANLRFVTGEQAVSVLDNDAYVIIDVRAEERHEAGYLKGSVSLPLFTVDADNKNVPVKAPYEDELSQAFLAYANENKEALAAKTIYILCNSGQTGVNNAFALMEQAEFTSNVFGISGGATNEDVKANFVVDVTWEAADFTYGEISQELYPASDHENKTTYSGIGITGLSESGTAKLAMSTDLVLPAKDTEGNKVIGVAEEAFASKGITSLTLPEEAEEWIIMYEAFRKNALTSVDLSNVVYLDGYAFAENKLTDVKFNEDIWHIAKLAFGSNVLETVEFPETTTHALNIDSQGFFNNKLTTVDLPNNVEKLTNLAFVMNPGVEEVNLDGATTAEKKSGVVYLYTSDLETFNRGGVAHLAAGSSKTQRLIYDGAIGEAEGRVYASGTDALAAVEAGTGIILDVRATAKTSNLYMPGAVNQPVFGPGVTTLKDQLAVDFVTATAGNEALAGKDIYIICNSGARGADAATKLLLSVGYAMEDIITITGGATDNAIMDAFEVTQLRTDGTERVVTGEQAVSVIDKAEYAIIDVRAEEKHAVGHLKGSVSLPLFTINPENNRNVPITDFKEGLAADFTKYVKDNAASLSTKSIYILCNSGATGAKNAAKLLYNAGYNLDNVYTITGGAGGDVVKANLRFVTAAQAISVMDNDNYVIIDVRAEKRNAAGYLEGSVSLPLFTVNAEDKNVPVQAPYEDELSQAFLAYVSENKETLATKTIYILCNSGQTGVKNAFALMEQAGFTSNVFGISGGATNASLQEIFVKDRVVGQTALSYKKLTYTGKVRVPAITVKNLEGDKLAKTDYTYEIINASGKAVSSPKAVGTYTIKITYTGKYAYNEPTELTYSIVPKAVTNLKATLADYNDVKLSWTKATGATGYYVYYKKSTTASYSTKYRKTVTGNTVTIKNLSDGVKYNFKVVPFFGKDKVTSVNATFINKTTLKKVTGVKVVRNGKKATVSWTNINGETGYQISRAANKTATANIKTFAGANLKSKTLTIPATQKYSYKVRAYKVENGKKVFGPWSSVVTK